MNWNHIILEAYCARKWNTKKDKYYYKVLSIDPLKTKKIVNPKYDPNYKTPKKPKYCNSKVSYNCHENNCPHLTTCNANKEDYKLFFGLYFKKHKNENNKENKKDDS